MWKIQWIGLTSSTNLSNEAHKLMIKNSSKTKLFPAAMDFIERADIDDPRILGEYD